MIGRCLLVVALAPLGLFGCSVRPAATPPANQFSPIVINQTPQTSQYQVGSSTPASNVTSDHADTQEAQINNLRSKIAACDVDIQTAIDDYKRDFPDSNYRDSVAATDQANNKIYGIRMQRWRYQVELHNLDNNTRVDPEPQNPIPVGATAPPAPIDVN